MSIALINPPNKFPFANARIPPIGIGYISSYAKLKGIDCKIYDLDNFPFNLTNAADLILSSNPEVIGLTCYEQNYFIVRKICQIIKKRSPKTIIVIGGPASTFAYEDILRDSPFIDICVCGEGEQAVLEIFKNTTENKEKWYNIKGIGFRDGEIVTTEKRPLIKDLDSIPSPYLTEIFDMRHYISGIILSGRGCPMKCIFCSCGAMFGSVRFHSPQRVLSEIDYLVKSNEKYHWKKSQILFSFVDDTLTASKKHVNAILDGLEERKYKVLWTGETRITNISKELLIRMKQLGLRALNFGLESADAFILKTIQKLGSANSELKIEHDFLNKFEEVLNWTHELGIKTTVSFIVGLPFETKIQANKTINFCRELKKKYGTDFIPNILVPFHGTEIFNKYRKYNMKIKKNPQFLLPYFIKKYSAVKINELLDIFPFDSNFTLDEIFRRSLKYFKKIPTKNQFKTIKTFKKLLYLKQFNPTK